MTERKSLRTLKIAAEKCARTGSKLTDKRSRILTILVESDVPLSAYEIVDQYNAAAEKSMPPMSVYRILEFLEKEELVHKLASENKFVACSHIVCNHDHQVPQFLICRQCHRVKEIAIERSLIKGLQRHVTSAGYQLMSPQLELDCLCDQCSTAA